jgi:hypothetical protein
MMMALVMALTLLPAAANSLTAQAAGNDQSIIESQPGIDIFINAGLDSTVLSGPLRYALRAAIIAEFEHRIANGTWDGNIPSITIGVPYTDLDTLDLSKWHVFDHFDNDGSHWSGPTNHGRPCCTGAITPAPEHWRYIGQAHGGGTVRNEPNAGEFSVGWNETNFTNFTSNQMPRMRLYDWVHRTFDNEDNNSNRTTELQDGSGNVNITGDIGRGVQNGRPRTNAGSNANNVDPNNHNLTRPGRDVDTLGTFDRHILTSEDPDSGEPRIDFVGYYRDARQDFLIYPSTSRDIKSVTFDVDSMGVNTHTLDGAGFLVNAGIRTDQGPTGLGANVERLYGYLLYYVFTEEQAWGAVPSGLILYHLNGVPVSEMRNFNNGTAAAVNFSGGYSANKSNSNFFGNTNTSARGANGFVWDVRGIDPGFTPPTASAITLRNFAGNADRTAGNPIGIPLTSAGWANRMQIHLEVSPDHIEVKQRPYDEKDPDAEWDDIRAIMRYNIPPSTNNITPLGRTGEFGFGPYVGYNGHACNRASQFTFLNLEMKYIAQSDDIFTVMSSHKYDENADKYFIDLTDCGTDRDNSDSDAAAYMQSNEIDYITNNPNPSAVLDDVAPNSYKTEEEKDTDKVAEEIARQIVDNYIRNRTTGRPQPTTVVPAGFPVPKLLLVRDLSPGGNTSFTSVSALYNSAGEVRADLISDNVHIYVYDAHSEYSQNSIATKITEWHYVLVFPDGTEKPITPHKTNANNGGAAMFVIKDDDGEWPVGRYEVRLRVKDDWYVDGDGLSPGTAMASFRIVRDTDAPIVPWVKIDTDTGTMSFAAHDESNPSSPYRDYGVTRYQLEIVAANTANANEIEEQMKEWAAKDPTRRSVSRSGDIITVTVLVDAPNSTSNRERSRSNELTFDDIHVPEGDYTWRLHVDDLAGNRTTVNLPSFDYSIPNSEVMKGLKNNTTVNNVTGDPGDHTSAVTDSGAPGSSGGNTHVGVTPDTDGEFKWVRYTNTNTTSPGSGNSSNGETVVTVSMPPLRVDVEVKFELDNDPFSALNGQRARLYRANPDGSRGAFVKEVDIIEDSGSIGADFGKLLPGDYIVVVPGVLGDYKIEVDATGVTPQILKYWTVTFDPNGGEFDVNAPAVQKYFGDRNAVYDPIDKSYTYIVPDGAKIDRPDDPKRGSEEFSSWNDENNNGRRWNFQDYPVTEPTTLTARYGEPKKYIVIVVVVDDIGSPLPGATVEIEDPDNPGSYIIADDKGDGEYWFYNIKEGIYEVIIKKINGSEITDRTVTKVIVNDDTDVADGLLDGIVWLLPPVVLSGMKNTCFEGLVLGVASGGALHAPVRGGGMPRLLHGANGYVTNFNRVEDKHFNPVQISAFLELLEILDMDEPDDQDYLVDPDTQDDPDKQDDPDELDEQDDQNDPDMQDDPDTLKVPEEKIEPVVFSGLAVPTSSCTCIISDWFGCDGCRGEIESLYEEWLKSGNYCELPFNWITNAKDSGALEIVLFAKEVPKAGDTVGSMFLPDEIKIDRVELNNKAGGFGLTNEIFLDLWVRAYKWYDKSDFLGDLDDRLDPANPLDLWYGETGYPTGSNDYYRNLSELPDLLQVSIPLTGTVFDGLGENRTPRVFRVHDGNATELPIAPNKNSDGEFFEIMSNHVVLHVRKFSVFSIASAEQQLQQTQPSGNGNGGGESRVNYTVTLKAEGEGGGSGSITGPGSLTVPSDSTGTNSVASGGSRTYNIIPDDGSRILDVLVNGESRGSVNQVTLNNITGDRTVIAKFIPDNWFIIDAKAGSGGSVTNPGRTGAAPGSDHIYRFTPDEGWYIYNVIVNGRPMGPMDFFDIRGIDLDYTIEVMFTRAKPPELLSYWDHSAYIIGYPDGTVQPMGAITREEVATIFFRLLIEDIREQNLTDENPYDDVNPGLWSNTAISTLTKLGILKGRSDTIFDPHGKVTRAELAAIATRFDELTGGTSSFSDIAGHWAEEYIISAAERGWVTGYDGRFRPDDNITRAESMALINRVLGRRPEVYSDLIHDGMITWIDNMNREMWYYLYVQEATNSHHYARKPDGIHETWTEIADVYEWIRYER